MKEETRQNVRMTWISSFVAFYNTANLAAAGRTSNIKGDTIRDNVRRLEEWLHRPLMDEGSKVPTPTLDAVGFFPDAVEILDLLNSEGLKGGAKRSRVTIDGVYLDNDVPLRIPEAIRVGQLLARFRRDPANAMPLLPNEKTSGSSIDMSWYRP